MTSDGTNWPLAWGSAEVRALLDVRRDSYEFAWRDHGCVLGDHAPLGCR